MFLFSLFCTVIFAEEVQPVLDEELYQQLSARDGIGSCQQLQERFGDDYTQKQLQLFVEKDVKPSAVPMRAATCLLTLYPNDLSRYRSWMQEKSSYGLARLTISHFETLPDAVVSSLTTAALYGENKERLRPNLEQNPHPIVENLLKQEAKEDELP